MASWLRREKWKPRAAAASTSNSSSARSARVSPGVSVGSDSSATLLAASASATSGSARNARDFSFRIRYIRMLEAADTHTSSGSSVRTGL